MNATDQLGSAPEVGPVSLPPPAPGRREPPTLRTLARARTARRLLLVACALIATDIAWTVLGVVAMAGLWAPDDWTTWWDRTQTILTIARVAGVLVAGLAVIRCQRELLRGLSAAGVRRVDPGVTWAAISWFVPLINLAVPYLSIRRVAGATAPQRRAALTSLVGGWWAFWLLGGLGERAAEGLFLAAKTPPLWLAAAACNLAGSSLLVWGGVLLAELLPRLASEQAEVNMLVAVSDRAVTPFGDVAELGRWLDETLPTS